MQADLLALHFPAGRFTMILGLGLTHLFEDLPELVRSLRTHLAPEGHLYLAGLVTETARGRRFLQILHRAGEAATPRSAVELSDFLDGLTDFKTKGCMAYATISA